MPLHLAACSTRTAQHDARLALPEVGNAGLVLELLHQGAAAACPKQQNDVRGTPQFIARCHTNSAGDAWEEFYPVERNAGGPQHCKLPHYPLDYRPGHITSLSHHIQSYDQFLSKSYDRSRPTAQTTAHSCGMSGLRRPGSTEAELLSRAAERCPGTPQFIARCHTNSAGDMGSGLCGRASTLRGQRPELTRADTTFASLGSVGLTGRLAVSPRLDQTIRWAPLIESCALLRACCVTEPSSLASMGRSTPADDLLGKVALVTGANSGIGSETAAALAARGATVILGCRNKTAAQQVAEQIKYVEGSHQMVPAACAHD
ncbi:putative dehydrogenase with different specificities related to short-chain alcohol dehydrogenase [Haematococcus lacustris]|uniref:Putative dehydrogenase with different specificities related to short-chain alcohol dehydrogenase n=1 Tax=Haematococcus lacustris TaxID=44745 RepID=A0A699YET1_HAELA|nr:putative dehydrogenase with different specificities related to short-chain alcohol dehydrogenase [Haematococcus lacustris]